MQPQNLGIIDPSRLQLPLPAIEAVRVQQVPMSLLDFRLRCWNRWIPSPSAPKVHGTETILKWFAFAPVVGKKNPALQEASYDISDLQGEVSGEMQRRAIGAQFSLKRAVRSAAQSSAHSRFIAMNRTKKWRETANTRKKYGELVEQVKMLQEQANAIVMFLKKRKNKKRHYSISPFKGEKTEVLEKLFKKTCTKFKTRMKVLHRIQSRKGLDLTQLEMPTSI